MFISFESVLNRKREGVERKHPTPFALLPRTRLARLNGLFHRCGRTVLVRAFRQKSTGFGIAYTRASGFLSHNDILLRGMQRMSGYPSDIHLSTCY